MSRKLLCRNRWMSDHLYPCMRKPDHGGDHMAFYQTSDHPLWWTGDDYWSEDKDNYNYWSKAFGP